MNIESIQQTRYHLITRNLQEVLGDQHLMDLLKDPERIPICYFGTAPTSNIHVGYFCPLLKIADIVDANVRVIILIADIHAFLDNMKTSLEDLEERTQNYIRTITLMLTRLNVDMSKIEFIRGSTFQLDKNYTMDVYKMNSFTTYSDARHAGAEVVRQTNNPTMNSLLYPSLQALDMHYLKADMFLGGIDQRKINVFASEMMPKIGYNKGIYLMNPIIPGLSKSKDDIAKMSASDNDSKIDIFDTYQNIKKKINRCYCLPKDSSNSIMTFANKLVFPILNRLGHEFVINRPEKYGGKLVYKNYDTLQSDFIQGLLHPTDLKLGVSDALDMILGPIRESDS